MPSNIPDLVFYDTTDRNADLRYFGKFEAPDAFLAMRLRGVSIGVFGALELGRARKQSAFDECLSFETLAREARAPRGEAGVAAVAAYLARRSGVRRLFVGSDFPLGLARALERRGFKPQVCGGALFPERVVKTAKEAAAVALANRAASAAFERVETLLRQSRVRGGMLRRGGVALTSETLRAEIERVCFEQGARSDGTIAAGGRQACDPHCQGFGPLAANSLIVVDIFPRGARGYFGDMTRTFLRGVASDAQRKMVATVRGAQKMALAQVRAGVSGDAVHGAVRDYFETRGYATALTPDGAVGFFHGTGHGVGLEIHEEPRLSVGAEALPEGAVVTVEPGLYYPEIGGCRIEDTVWVKKTAARLLSHYPYRWEL